MASIFVKLLGTVVIFSTLFSRAHCAPLPTEDGRWVNPCGDAAPTFQLSLIPLPTPPPRPIGEQLESLKLMSLTATSLTGEISYTIRSRISNGVADELEKREKYLLTGFPSVNSSYTTNIKLEDMIHSDAERVAKIGVFLEQARLDTYDYTEKIKQLENKYTELLCQMHLTLEALNQEVTSTVSRDVMADVYRTLTSTSQIDQRNYMIIRDAQIIFDVIAEGTDAYMKHNSLL